MSTPPAKRIEIRRGGTFRHKWTARFIADGNREVLAITPQRQTYHNLGDLKAMLARYFPDWPITIRQGTRTTIHTHGKHTPPAP